MRDINLRRPHSRVNLYLSPKKTKDPDFNGDSKNFRTSNHYYLAH